MSQRQKQATIFLKILKKKLTEETNKQKQTNKAKKTNKATKQTNTNKETNKRQTNHKETKRHNTQNFLSSITGWR